MLFHLCSYLAKFYCLHTLLSGTMLGVGDLLQSKTDRTFALMSYQQTSGQSENYQNECILTNCAKCSEGKFKSM